MRLALLDRRAQRRALLPSRCVWPTKLLERARAHARGQRAVHRGRRGCRLDERPSPGNRRTAYPYAGVSRLDRPVETARPRGAALRGPRLAKCVSEGVEGIDPVLTLSKAACSEEEGRDERRRRGAAAAGAGMRLDCSTPGGEIAARSPLQLFWRRFRRDRVALASLGFIVFLILLAIAAPLVVRLLGLPGPNVQNPNLTDAFGSPLGPSAAHPFGVDQLGQDVMSRVIYGRACLAGGGDHRHRRSRPSSASSSACSPASTAAGPTRCSRA